MKRAYVHDWLVTYGGAERCLEALIEAIPGEIFTLIADLNEFRGTAIASSRIRQSFIGRLPFRRHFRSYLPLFPIAVERFDLSGYDVVVSLSHAVAKGVITRPDQLHVCYCCTPMRYAWDFTHEYQRQFGFSGGLRTTLLKVVLHYIRLWDYASAARVDHFVAISKYIAQRIAKCYGKKASVVYPPVDIERFSLCKEKEDYYLTASRLVPYKRFDQIVDAFARLPKKHLIVAGVGEELEKLKKRATPNVRFLGYTAHDELKRLMQHAKAFIFNAEEDFGIVPVEAMACGTPVIGLGKGGLRETVVPGKTGLLYTEQSSRAIAESIEAFEMQNFDYEHIRSHAEFFGKERFLQQMTAVIEQQREALSL